MVTKTKLSLGNHTLQRVGQELYFKKSPNLVVSEIKRSESSHLMIIGLELSHPLFMFQTSFLWYNETMAIINQFVTLASHLVFIGLSYQMLISLFDWAKIIKNPIENTGKLKLFLLFISIALGYLISSFILSVLAFGQNMASSIS